MEKKSKVLIVEDEFHIAQGLAFNLKHEGHEVEIAKDGQEALDLWKSFNPHLYMMMKKKFLAKIIQVPNQKNIH